jgi:hypothetical protein
MGQLIPAGYLERKTVEEALTEAAVATGLPLAEIRKTLRSAIGAGIKKPRDPLAGSLDTSDTRVQKGFATLTSHLDTSDTSDTESVKLPEITSLLDIMDAEYPPLQWVIPEVIPEGFGILAGAPKTGKSWLALQLALMCASGGAMFGNVPVSARPVLYLTLEDGKRRIKDRATKLLAGAAVPSKLDTVTRATHGELFNVIPYFLALNPVGLVILDTLGKVMPQKLPGENEYGRDYRIGGQLKSYVDKHPGSALLVVHHTRKMLSADWSDMTSGTNGLNGSADYNLLLRRERRGNTGTLDVTGRDVNEDKYALVMDDGTWRLDGETLGEARHAARTQDEPEPLGGLMIQIRDYVNKQTDPVTPQQVAQALGIENEYAGKCLGRLVKRCDIQRNGRGQYIALPYR